PPQFGFAVSGMLAARYGFRVSVDSVSPYGGVRAVVLIPDELLTTEVPQPAAPAEAPEAYDAYGTQQEPEAAQPDRWQQAPTPLFPPADRRPDTATQQLAQ
ncbi:ATP-binding protein, partial [Streptomyces sp. SID8455]|nr:ATP-binding protein [Streptomyces sp. SID8455]